MQNESYRKTVVDAIKNGAVNSISDFEGFSPMADIVGTIRPAAVNKKNAVSGILRALGWITIVCGVGGSLFLFVVSFMTAISTIAAGAIGGTMLLGFAEVIDLLQELVNRSDYNVNLRNNRK